MKINFVWTFKINVFLNLTNFECVLFLYILYLRLSPISFWRAFCFSAFFLWPVFFFGIVSFKVLTVFERRYNLFVVDNCYDYFVNTFIQVTFKTNIIKRFGVEGHALFSARTIKNVLTLYQVSVYEFNWANKSLKVLYNGNIYFIHFIIILFECIEKRCGLF